jgi:hypothetical protein
VHGDGLADDEAILDELADGLAGVGVGDFADLVGVEPDLALSATDHGGREALLSAEVDPVRHSLSVFDLICGCGQWRKVLSCRAPLSTSRLPVGPNSKPWRVLQLRNCSSIWCLGWCSWYPYIFDGRCCCC